MKTQNNSKRALTTRQLTTAAIIAALYVVLTLISSALGIASGVIQVRISEALTILPCFTVAAVPGVTIGCLLANFVTGAPLPDVIFGTLATLIGVIGARLLKKKPFLAPLPTILANAIIIPFVLRFAYGVPDAIWFMFLTVGAGEVISAGILGILLYKVLKKQPALFQ